ncbi:S8 family serine peptidase [Sphaerotilus mobilis]|uniref:Serine protease n=1 Tax=Sphaerotilus mobilis TaxID=47994 RepID=A0A4V2EVD1_9BURK|nr:S8 family serine peptidase [Sphaerotilus mobilis]RZS52070.1 serine protease [Sphaerotilus mobilis]
MSPNRLTAPPSPDSPTEGRRRSGPGWIALGVALGLTLALGACGGSGKSTHDLSGRISVAANAAVDSDLNDVGQLTQRAYTVNDLPDQAQPVTAPLLLVGTVNVVGTGPAGNNFEPGDADDWFQVDLVAGQVVELESAADPLDADLDLYVLSATGPEQGSSIGVDTRHECVRVTTGGTYRVNVYAFSGAAIYNLRIGAPDTASACPASTAAVATVPGQLVAQPRSTGPVGTLATSARANLDARLATSGILGLPASGDAGRPHLLRLPASPAGRAQAQQVLRGTNAAVSSSKSATSTTAQVTAAVQADSPARALTDTLKLAKALQATGAYDYVQPNHIHQRLQVRQLVGTYPPNDRSYVYQRWHYEQIQLPAAMERIAGLPTQPTLRPIVAVIDDGVMLNHPDLAPQLASSGRAFLSNVRSGDGNLASGDNTAGPADQPVFHGTHVAGTVAASTFDGIGGAGVAPMALILPLRVFPASGGATTNDIVNAMRYAAGLSNNTGLLPARKADVINMSLGSDGACEPAFRDAIAAVRAAGVAVVVAAGNSAAPVGSPANCAGAIAVSALDAQAQKAPYSNVGEQIALAAPGGDTRRSTTGTGVADAVYSDIATFDANGVRQPAFGGMQGTSMAAPHVAGVLALMRYVHPGLTVDQIDALLVNGSLGDDLGATGHDTTYGHGRVNARKAVDAALALAGGAPAPEGRVIATPSRLDLGSIATLATLDLGVTATTSERVVSVTSDNPAITAVAPTSSTAGLGRYTVQVNRAALAVGTFYANLSFTVSTAGPPSSSRTLVVPVSVRKLAAGASVNGDLGPIYVLLIDPDSGNTVAFTLANRASDGTLSWRHAGYAGKTVSVVAGSDLDNDDFICQRGEACGAYPLLSANADLAVITLNGDRSDLDLQVAPLSGIAIQAASAGGKAGPRGGWSLQPAVPLKQAFGTR